MLEFHSESSESVSAMPLHIWSYSHTCTVCIDTKLQRIQKGFRKYVYIFFAIQYTYYIEAEVDL